MKKHMDIPFIPVKKKKLTRKQFLELAEEVRKSFEEEEQYHMKQYLKALYENHISSSSGCHC